jgi:hypothetical protein
VTKGQVFAALNRDRKASGLAVLKDPTMVTRLLDSLAGVFDWRRCLQVARFASIR